MDALIYDRTQADVTNRADKAYWQVSDIERINEYIDYLGAELSVSVSEYAPVLGDLLDAAWIAQFLADIQAIRTAANWGGLTPTVPNHAAWNYVKANSVEKILQDAFDWANARIALYRYCGVTTCGAEFEF